jgi:hypothetical protein
MLGASVRERKEADMRRIGWAVAVTAAALISLALAPAFSPDRVTPAKCQQLDEHRTRALSEGGLWGVADIEAVLGPADRDSRSGPPLFCIDAGVPAPPGEYQLNWVGREHLALAVVNGQGEVTLFWHLPWQPESWPRQLARRFGVRLPIQPPPTSPSPVPTPQMVPARGDGV